MERLFFSETVSAVMENLGTDPVRGLSAAEARARLARDGANKLAEAIPSSWWRELLEQFNQLVIWILIAATAVSGMLGDWLEAGANFAIVLLNALLGFSRKEKRRKRFLLCANSPRPVREFGATARCIRSPRKNWCAAMSWTWKPAIVSRRICA